MGIVEISTKNWKGVINIFSRFWKLYGGFYEVFCSPYMHVALVITMISFKVWSNAGWWDTPISILPMFLAFSLTGLAIFISLGISSFGRFLVSVGPDDKSAFLSVVGSFISFNFWQLNAFILSIISKALFFKWNNAPDIYIAILPFAKIIGWGVSYLIFIYSVLLLLAATFSLFRVAGWYEAFYKSSNNNQVNQVVKVSDD